MQQRQILTVIAVLSVVVGTVAYLGFRQQAEPFLAASDCSFDYYSGQTALNDLGTGTYNSWQGGLYPGGSNTRPTAHTNAGTSIANAVGPLDANGNPSPSGKYVLISIGLSNTKHAFESFIPLADADPAKNSKLVIVNGAQGGGTSAKWADPNHAIWGDAMNALSSAGVTAKQVVAVWLKATGAGGIDPLVIQDDLETVARHLKTKFPNVKLAYYSARSYGGYGGPTGLSPEPHAYRHGFSVKWTIEKQINGDLSLAYSGSNAVAPWLSWGPYYWANGLGSDRVTGGIPGRTNSGLTGTITSPGTNPPGLEWECGDYTDGTHQTDQGKLKIAQMLLNFFKTDVTACGWFTTGTNCDNPPPPPPPPPSVLPGDLDNDGDVDQADLNVLVSQWLGSGSADINGDGTVNHVDAGILFSNWGSAPPPPPPPPSGGIWKPALNTSWQWQLTALPVDQSVDAIMYDIDLFDNDTSVVSSLHAAGRKVVCYLSAGSWEEWRPDAGSFPATVKGNNNGWPGEKWLDIRQLSILGPIMEARLDLCKSKGFDGIEPDNVDGYTNNTGFPLSYNDQLTYNRFLATEAHERGLSVGLKNDVEQVPDLLADFDWTLNEECFSYNECDTLLSFINAGKAVFQVEYALNTNQFCPQANSLNFNSMKKNLDLDAFRVPCR